MPYKKTIWIDTLKDAQGNIIQRGTPINSANLNKIEEWIAQTDIKLANGVGNEDIIGGVFGEEDDETAIEGGAF